MANEATLIVETSIPLMFTCADGTGIEKGTLLKLSDPMTVAATSADNDIFAGIAAEEKIASDGNTKIAVYVQGVFKVKDSSGGVTAGDTVVVKGANLVGTHTTLDQEKGYKVGRALETAAASETFLCYVNLI
jgi:hypothetical protein